MKKNYLIIMILILTFVFSGCGDNQNQDIQDGMEINMYYLNKEETKITTEIKNIEYTSTKEMIVVVLQMLAKAPENVELKSPISSAFTIVSYAYEDGKVTVTFSEKYKNLSNTTEILTRAAIVRTLTQVPGVENVCMTINGEPLTDSAGNAVGFMTANDFIDNEGEEINAYEKTVLRLYFANENGDKLVAINRSIIYNSNISLEKLVVEQLISGPISNDSYQTLNPNTKLISTNVKDGVCYVDFDSSFLNQNLKVTSDVTIYSIVNSLVELSNVNKVQFSVDGESTATFKEKYPLTTVFERNLSMIE